MNFIIIVEIAGLIVIERLKGKELYGAFGRYADPYMRDLRYMYPMYDGAEEGMLTDREMVMLLVL